jgi:ferredoxin-NAD(P)+ reductase (naphthalene dioxygenase ferredoxin-specific)
MEVLVQPLQKSIQVAPGANLLDALRGAQVPMSYSCMAGRCGTCRCRLVHGEVFDAGRQQQNPLDIENDYVLACQTFLTESCTIEIPEPDEIVVHAALTVRATVLSLESLTPDVRRLVLRPAKPFEWSPGQHAQLQFKSGFMRPYSMAGLDGDGSVEFHVRVAPGGRVSGYVANALQPGDAVKLSGPLGIAYLRRKHDGPMLCVAAGTGLAPILSILRGAVAYGMNNPVHVYVGARSAREVYGLQALALLQRVHPALTLHVVVATGGDRRTQRNGLVTDAIDKDLRDLSGWRAYLFGSPPMVEAATMLVRRKGLEPARIHAEAFYTQPA